jgi:hypothetical protein
MARPTLPGIACVIAFGLTAGVTAQGPRADMLRIAAPSLPCGVYSYLVELSIKANVAIGFEAAPNHCWNEPFEPRKASTPMIVGDSVDTFLDWLVAAQSGYSWQRMGDMVVVRPVSAWGDPANLLARQVGPFAATIHDLDMAMDVMSRSVTTGLFRVGPDYASLVRLFATADPALRGRMFGFLKTDSQGPPWAVMFNGGTLLDALHGLTHGGSSGMGWVLNYCRPSAEEGDAVLMAVVTDASIGRATYVALLHRNNHANPCL